MHQVKILSEKSIPLKKYFKLNQYIDHSVSSVSWFEIRFLLKMNYQKKEILCDKNSANVTRNIRGLNVADRLKFIQTNNEEKRKYTIGCVRVSRFVDLHVGRFFLVVAVDFGII